MITVRMKIRGRVQGVFFRASTRKKARELGVRGWVANRSDGSVECVAQGEEDALEALIAWAQEGPEMARVDEVEMLEPPDGERFVEFTVRSS